MSVLSDTRARMGQRSMFWRILLMASIPLVLIAIAAYLYLTAGRTASTDDAYVQADKIVVSSDVSGRVVAVEVKDNQYVKAGQVLIRLDDASYKIALAKVQANLAATKLQIDGLRATYKQRQSDRQGRPGHARLHATRSGSPGADAGDAHHLAAKIRRGAAQSRCRARPALLDATAAEQRAGESRRQSRYPDRPASVGAAGPGAGRSGAARSYRIR